MSGSRPHTLHGVIKRGSSNHRRADRAHAGLVLRFREERPLRSRRQKTGSQSNRATEQQSNRATEQQSNRATEQQSNRATEDLSLLLCCSVRALLFQRQPRARLTSYRARSASRTSSSGEETSGRYSATPALTPTEPLRRMRTRSARDCAAAALPPGRMARNSSPP